MADKKIIDIDGLSRYHENLNTFLSTKQDTISDLAAIRSGAALGATSIQTVKTINGESILGSGNIEIKADFNSDDYYTKTEIEDKGYLYKVILKQAEYDALVEYDPQALYVISDAAESGQHNFVTEEQLNDRGFLTQSDKTEMQETLSLFNDTIVSLQRTIASLQARIDELEGELNDTLTI